LLVGRLQELRGHGGFYWDFKGRSGRPGNAWQGTLLIAPEQARCEADWVMHKLQWKPQDVGDAKNVGYLLCKAVDYKWACPGARHVSCKQQGPGQGCPLELTGVLMLHMEQQGTMFALWVSVLLLAHS
jgi:hypothetical protein